MKKYVNWQLITENGEDVATNFIKLANLSNEDTAIILDRKNGRKTQYATAMELGCSTRHITNRVNYLIDLYEKTQKKYPSILPELKKEKTVFQRECEYTHVNALVGIDFNDKVYTIKIIDGFFKSFEDMRLYVVDQLEIQYNIIIDDLDKYETYISGKYLRIKK